MDKKTLRSIDLVVSVFFLLLALCVGKWSLDLMRTSAGGRFYVSAGFLPFIFSLIFAAINLRIIMVALAEGGNLNLFHPAAVWKSITSPTGLRAVFILGWLAVYIFGMLRRLPYPISTFIFITVFMTVFYRKNMTTVLAVSVAATVLITVFFGTLARIPLP